MGCVALDRSLGMEGWVGCIAGELHNLVVEGIVVEEGHHIHLLLELETHREVVGTLAAAGHMEAAEEEGIGLVGHMVVVEGELRTVLEEVPEGLHIDLVAGEGIDLEEGRHIEAAGSPAGRKAAEEGELRIAVVEAAHHTVAVEEELRIAEEEVRHTAAGHKVVEGNDLVAGHHIAVVPEEHRREVDMPLSRVLCMKLVNLGICEPVQ